MDEVIDATRAPDWTFVAPKTAGGAPRLARRAAASALLAMVVQLAKGYARLESGRVSAVVDRAGAADLAIVAALAVFLQTIRPEQGLGLGRDHPLHRRPLRRAGPRPRAQPDPLRLDQPDAAVGHERPGAVLDRRLVVSRSGGRPGRRCCWFAANALWRRGAAAGWRARLARSRAPSAGPAGWIAAAARAGVIGAGGGWIAFNTLVLNPYQTQAVGRPLAGRLREDACCAYETCARAEPRRRAV